MIFYHIPTSTEYDDHGVFANKLTKCGQPWKLDLTQFDSVPVVREPLTETTIHGAPVLEVDGLSGKCTRYYYPVVEKLQEQRFLEAQESLTAIIQSYLDRRARARNYDSIISLCSYATSTDPMFSAEGNIGVAFRDACWRKGYEIMQAVVDGTWRERTPEEIAAGFFPVPTEEELLAALPEIVYPTAEEVQMVAAALDGVTAEEESIYSVNAMWSTIKGWFGWA